MSHYLWKYKILQVNFYIFVLYFIVFPSFGLIIRSETINQCRWVMSIIVLYFLMKYFKTIFFLLLIHLDSRNSREAIGSNLIRFRPILRHKGKCHIFYKLAIRWRQRVIFSNFILDLFGRWKSFSIGLFNLRCTSSIIQVLLSRRYFTQVLSKVSPSQMTGLPEPLAKNVWPCL